MDLGILKQNMMPYPLRAIFSGRPMETDEYQEFRELTFGKRNL